MLITTKDYDLSTQLDSQGRPLRVFVISPTIPNYPQAKFPGVVVFRHVPFPSIIPLSVSQVETLSEIYQVTGPVERFASQIASQGFVVACPSIYHEFQGPEPIPYDVEEGTDTRHVLTQLSAHLRHKRIQRLRKLSLPSMRMQNSALTCFVRWTTAMEESGVATGMCLGGHLALRAAFDQRVLASICFFATDVHSATLGQGKNDDTLIKIRKGDLTGKGELMIFGKQDTHVPRVGRDLIRTTLEDAGVTVSFLEVQAQHAFIRDESSKGRWDAALTRSLFSFMMEVYDRTIGVDLGTPVQNTTPLEHVC
ncbi:hypothetical protein D9757_002881 [Collybiopsis confluens]|uniref:Dienelactone hydrolase domain-containing protein n=1 Tax=Collybiopsis confluens TaxID=2823264 RepID=A0A8H5HVP8_9AGAR|nr:hypothetical protein D9757_002881 [Collybiopsis confluens]